MPIPAPIGVWLFILNAINDIPPIVSKPQTIIDDSKFKLLNHFCISKSTHHPINKKPHLNKANSITPAIYLKAIYRTHVGI